MPESEPTRRSFAVLRSFWTEAGRTAARNLTWLAVWTLLTQLGALGSVCLLTEGLGKERFGIFSFAVALQAFAYTIGCAGVKQVVVREGARRPEMHDAMMASHLVLTAVSSIVVATLILTGLGVASRSDSLSRGECWLIGTFAIGNVANCVTIMPFFDVQHRQPASAFVRFATELVALGAIWRMAATGTLSLASVGVVYASKWTVSAVVHYAYYHWRFARVRFRFVAGHLRAMIRSSWPLLVSGLLLMVPFTSGVFFVRAYHGPADTAIFGLAVQVATAYLIFGTIGVRIVQPHIAGRYGLDRSFVGKLMLFTVGYLGALLAAAWGGATLVITFVLAPEYRAATWPTLLVLVGVALFTVGRILAMYLVVLHRERTEMVCQLAATLAYVTGCVLLVPPYSYTGAAAMAVIANALGTGLTLFALMRSRAETRNE